MHKPSRRHPSRRQSSRRLNGWLAATGLATVLALGMSSGALAAGSVTVGLSTGLSGPAAEIGQTGRNGVAMAIDELNAHGGLLGKHVKLVTADGKLSPATGTANVRQMILSDKAVAIFGPLTSAVGIAEETVAAQYKIPYFIFTSNDVKMTTTDFTKYAFQVVPNTVMEPRAVAAYLAEKVGKKPITLATITPNYSFGRDTVAAFIKALQDDGVKVTVKAQETPQLGTKQYTSYIPVLMATKADYTFMGQYDGDLIALTKQAKGFGFFKQTHAMGLYNRAELMALPGQVPAGVIAWDRAPFWAMKAPGMAKFNADYHKKYHEWPAAWAILGYTAVETWVDGVKKAKSFDSDKVVDALSGATVDTIRGPIKLRACDHQGDVAEYVGTVASKIDPKYGFQIYDHTVAVPASKTMLTCAEATALQPHH